MLKRQSESTLLLLAVIGALFFFGIIIASSYMMKSSSAEDDGAQGPAISQQEAADAAIRFVKDKFQLSDNYEARTYYQTHAQRSGYLQREHLAEAYQEAYRNLPLDYYEVEINDLSLGTTTYYVDIHYENSQILGWMASFSPVKQETRVSATIIDPLSIAEQAIKDQGYVLSDFTRLEQSPSLEKKSLPPADAGRTFIYQSKTKPIGEARLHLALSVSGSKVIFFYPLFDIPASFVDWQEQQNKSASLMSNTSMLISLVMAAYALYIIIRYRREITFRSGLWLLLIFLVIYIGNNFNMLPAFRTSHSAGPSQLEAYFYLTFLNVIIAIMAVTVYLSILAGKQMWARLHWNPLPEWHSANFGSHAWTAMGRGYLLCLFILGVQQVLFFIAEHVFDVWSVNDASDSVLNMTFPALFPLMAWAAAISEEAVYRLFGIALFLKIVRVRFLAILLPSIIWAFSHTQYPIYPVYTRLVEVTIIGLIFGYAFLKYGFMTVLFAHASMDSILMGMSLFSLDDWMHPIIGSFYVLVPALVGWTIYKLHQNKIKRRAIFKPRLDLD